VAVAKFSPSPASSGAVGARVMVDAPSRSSKATSGMEMVTSWLAELFSLPSANIWVVNAASAIAVINLINSQT
jgi:hypothetical protein